MTNAKPVNDEYLEAAARGDAAGVRDCVARGADLSATDKVGLGAMTLAVRSNNADAVAAELLRLGYPANGYDKGATPLMVACGHDAPRVARMLLDAGARTDGALEWAIEYNCPEAVDMLLDAGADPYPVWKACSVLHGNGNDRLISDFIRRVGDEMRARERNPEGWSLSEAFRKGLGDDFSVKPMRLGIDAAKPQEPAVMKPLKFRRGRDGAFLPVF